MSFDHLDDLVVVGDGWSELPLNVSTVDAMPLPERATLFAGARLLVELPVSLTHQSQVRKSFFELGLSNSVYEAAVVGTPALVQARAAVDKVLAPGEEIVTFQSSEDLADLVPVLVADKRELEKIGEAAWSRVTAQHTWAQRWRSLFSPWVDDVDAARDEEVRYLGQIQSLSRAG